MTEFCKCLTGIDLGCDSHRVVVTSPQGRRIAGRDFKHTGQDLGALVDWLHGFSPEDHAGIWIAVENNHGAVVETLVMHGFRVFAINPKQSQQFRECFSAAGAKDDDRDAFVLANALRVDLKWFRPVQIDAPDILRLREVSRMLDEIKQDLRRNANRLWEQLHRYYAPLLPLCTGADEAWLWELLLLAPTPEKGRRLRFKTIADLLKRHRIRRHTPEDVLSALRADPLPVAPAVAEAAAELVALLVERLRVLEQQKKHLQQQQARLLATLEAPTAQSDPPSGDGSSQQTGPSPATAGEVSESGDARVPTFRNQPERPPSDAAILRSLPGAGESVCAALLCEAWQLLAERDLASLRGVTGIAAVTKQSGKLRQVRMRRACNSRLRNAMHYWAATALQNDAHMRAIYDRMRQSGKEYARALRGLGEHLLRVLVGALRSRTLYDPARWPENQTGQQVAETA